MVTDDIIEMLRSRVGSAFDGEATFSEDEIEKIVSALSSSPAPVAAGDWVMVPREPTPAMMRAGVSWSSIPAQTWQDMLDAAPTPPAPAQPIAAPVAWQHRIRPNFAISEWSPWLDGRAPQLRTDNYEAEERPLFAAPSASEAQVRVAVKPLEWKERIGVAGTFDAETPIGHFIASATDDGRAFCFIVGLTRTNYAGTNVDEAKAAAQADYEERIRSALASETEGGLHE